jgi:predicted DNA-binding ribbon-helix-helix protein
LGKGRIKRQKIIINGRNTSLRLEPEFHWWLRQVACELRTTITGLIAEIDKARNPDCSLSSTLRVFVTAHLHDLPKPPRKPPRSVRLPTGRLIFKHRRVDLFGHQTSLRLELAYWDWIDEIRAKTGASLRDVLEGTALTKNPKRPLSSAIRVKIAAYFNGSPYPLYRCPGRIVPGRDGTIYGFPFASWGRALSRAEKRAAAEK